MKSLFACIILQLDSTESDSPILEAVALQERNINLLEEVQKHSAMGITSSS
jgi:hypothetical protein